MFIIILIVDNHRVKHLMVKLKKWEKEFLAKNGIPPTQVCYIFS